MKTMTLNKVLALILTACLSTVLSFSSYAASLPVHEQSSEFVPTSKAEYVSTVAKSHGISEEEVLQELESKKEAFLETYGVYDSDSSDIEMCGFDGSYTEPMPGGVTLIYGYVTFTDTYAGAFDVQSTCAAVIASHHYGRSFYSVDSTAYAFASNSGAWDFDSVSCQVNSSNTSVTISYNGVIDCPYDVAVSLGVSDFFGFEAGTSTTVHGRQYVSNANTYTC